MYHKHLYITNQITDPLILWPVPSSRLDRKSKQKSKHGKNERVRTGERESSRPFFSRSFLFSWRLSRAWSRLLPFYHYIRQFTVFVPHMQMLTLFIFRNLRPGQVKSSKSCILIGYSSGQDSPRSGFPALVPQVKVLFLVI